MRSREKKVKVAEVSARLAEIRAIPGMVAFVALLDGAIRRGDATTAHRMLVAVGAKPVQAFNCTDGWPVKDEDRRLPREVFESREDEASYRFTFYCPGFKTVNWNQAMVVGTRAARVAREKEIDSDGKRIPPPQ